MAIINRLARLFKADLNAVLDHIEEPEQLLKQSIREMQDTTLTLQGQIKQRKLELDVLSDRQELVKTKITKTCEEITICFENDNQDLARSLIRRKLEAELILIDITEAEKEVRKALEALEEQHDQCSETLNDIQSKAQLMANLNRDSAQGNEPGGKVISDDDIEVELIKQQQRFAAHAS